MFLEQPLECAIPTMRPCLYTGDPFVSALPFSEQNDFFKIQAFFQLTDDRNKRNMGMSTFEKHLKFVKSYVMRGDGGDIERGMAVGIYFLDDKILVNTRRLKQFMRRSKSCLNGCFHKLGYTVTKPSVEASGMCKEFLGKCGKNAFHPRQWCIRSKGNTQVSPMESPKKESIAFGIDIRSLLN